MNDLIVEDIKVLISAVGGAKLNATGSDAVKIVRSMDRLVASCNSYLNQKKLAAEAALKEQTNANIKSRQNKRS